MEISLGGEIDFSEFESEEIDIDDAITIIDNRHTSCTIAKPKVEDIVNKFSIQNRNIKVETDNVLEQLTELINVDDDFDFEIMNEEYDSETQAAVDRMQWDSIEDEESEETVELSQLAFNIYEAMQQEEKCETMEMFNEDVTYELDDLSEFGDIDLSEDDDLSEFGDIDLGDEDDDLSEFGETTDNLENGLSEFSSVDLSEDDDLSEFGVMELEDEQEETIDDLEDDLSEFGDIDLSEEDDDLSEFGDIDLNDEYEQEETIDDLEDDLSEFGDISSDGEDTYNNSEDSSEFNNIDLSSEDDLSEFGDIDLEEETDIEEYYEPEEPEDDISEFGNTNLEETDITEFIEVEIEESDSEQDNIKETIIEKRETNEDNFTTNNNTEETNAELRIRLAELELEKKRIELELREKQLELEKQRIESQIKGSNQKEIIGELENDNIAKDIKDDVDIKKKEDNSQEQLEVYNAMSIESLFLEVKAYLIEQGVAKRAIDMSLLNTKFGDSNIKRLLRKSYLIKIGKGVTIGR